MIKHLQSFRRRRRVLASVRSLVAQCGSRDRVRHQRRSLKTPNDIFVGEVGGVGANSKGQIFVYTRTGHPYATLGDNRTFSRGGSRLFQFDQNGKFVRELGQDVYGFNAAIGLRVDPQDNVWTIDAAREPGREVRHRGARRAGPRPQAGDDRRASTVPAPAAAGRPERRAEAGRGGAAGGAPGRCAWRRSWRRRRRRGTWRGSAGRTRWPRAPGAGVPGSGFSRPTDVAWDRAGNIYIADGIGNNNRVAKFDKEGGFIKHWGSTGSEPVSSTA